MKARTYSGYANKGKDGGFISPRYAIRHDDEPVTAIDKRDVDPLVYRARALVKEMVPAGATKRLPDNVVTRELLHNLVAALQPFEESTTTEGATDGK